MATTFLRPSEDIEVGNWLNELGGSTLYTSINESSPDDDNYAVSGNLLDGPDTFVVKLSPGDFPVLPCTLRRRYYKLTSDGQQVDLTVTLYQDYGGGGEAAIASALYEDIGESPFTAELLVEGGITDFTDLYLAFTANIPGGGEHLSMSIL